MDEAMLSVPLKLFMDIIDKPWWISLLLRVIYYSKVFTSLFLN